MGARILAPGPVCVTLGQSLAVSGPNIFIFEMHSLACLSWLTVRVDLVPALGWTLSGVLKPEEDKVGGAPRGQDRWVQRPGSSGRGGRIEGVFVWTPETQRKCFLSECEVMHE